LASGGGPTSEATGPEAAEEDDTHIWRWVGIAIAIVVVILIAIAAFSGGDDSTKTLLTFMAIRK
jgi:anti-sigma-K factor RskA